MPWPGIEPWSLQAASQSGPAGTAASNKWPKPLSYQVRLVIFFILDEKCRENDGLVLAVNDSLDDILGESGDEEEQDAVVNQVLDEIGIEISGKVCTLSHCPSLVIKWQLTTCLKSSKPTKISACRFLWASTSTACSQHPIWSNMAPVDTTTQWRKDWSSASVVNHSIVTDPTIWQPRFDLLCLNRFRTGHGPCHANLHKWGLVQSPSCDYGQQQTMNYLVDTCPLTKSEGGLKLLQSYGWNQ